MTKYDGIEKADSTLAPSGEIKLVKPKKASGYFSGFLARLLIAALLLGAVFGIKAAGFGFSETVTNTVTQVVSYDLFDRTDDGTYLIVKSEK